MSAINQNPVEHIFTEVCPKDDSLDGVIEIIGRFGLHNLGYESDLGLNPGYTFRGEIDYDSPLQSGLERKAIELNYNGIGRLKHLEKERVEKYMLSKGAQVARLREPVNSKNLEDIFWWLSWMQHYGEATRFIDFTRDIRFAMYFALEQFFGHQKRVEEAPPKDLIIYCFPCKDLIHSKDEDNNKSPFSFNYESIDMNLALGCEIDLDWMKPHKPHYQVKYGPTRHKQFFGWDRPYYKNPRIDRQRGMFVYAFDYPEIALASGQESWFIRNLSKSCKGNDPYIPENTNLPATRIRISHKHADNLNKIVEDRFGLYRETVYL